MAPVPGVLVGEVNTQRELVDAVRAGIVEWSEAMHALQENEEIMEVVTNLSLFLQRLTDVLKERGRLTALIIALVGIGFWGGLLLCLQVATATTRVAVRINVAGLRSLVWSGVKWWVPVRLLLTVGATGAAIALLLHDVEEQARVLLAGVALLAGAFVAQYQLA